MLTFAEERRMSGIHLESLAWWDRNRGMRRILPLKTRIRRLPFWVLPCLLSKICFLLGFEFGGSGQIWDFFTRLYFYLEKFQLSKGLRNFLSSLSTCEFQQKNIYIPISDFSFHKRIHTNNLSVSVILLKIENFLSFLCIYTLVRSLFTGQNMNEGSLNFYWGFAALIILSTYDVYMLVHPGGRKKRTKLLVGGVGGVSGSREPTALYVFFANFGQGALCQLEGIVLKGAHIWPILLALKPIYKTCSSRFWLRLFSTFAFFGLCQNLWVLKPACAIHLQKFTIL